MEDTSCSCTSSGLRAAAVLSLLALLLMVWLAPHAEAQSPPEVVGRPVIANAPGGDGKWGPGERIEVTLTFSEPVTVTGTPTVDVEFGSAGRGEAAYTSGSGTASLTFTYQLQGRDGYNYGITLKHNSLRLGGGTIRSAGGIDALLAHNGLGKSGTVDASFKPLRAVFNDVPDNHDGSSVFTFELRFSEDIAGLSFRTVRDNLLDVRGGTVRRAKRVTAHSNEAFRIHIRPHGLGDVTVVLKPPTVCGVPGTICTADGRLLSNSLLATITGPDFQSQVPPDADTPDSDMTQLPPDADTPDSDMTQLPPDADTPDSDITVPSTLWVSDGTFSGAGMAFTVSLSPARSSVTQVDFATADGTAKAGQDYQRTSGTLTFGPGETHKIISVAVLKEVGADDREFKLSLSNPTYTGNVTLQRAVATGTLRNPSMSVADAEAQEGPGATLAFVVTLSRALSIGAEVNFVTAAGGTATAGADYTASSGTLFFAPGETQKTISIPVLDDAHDEGDETLFLILLYPRPSGLWLNGEAAIGTIRNQDANPKAWLARFGRTAAEQVLDAVQGRLAAGRRVATDDHMAAQKMDDWLHGDLPALRGDVSPELTSLQDLAGTQFTLVTEHRDGGGYATVWARGALSSFDGDGDDELTLDGELASAMLGADWTHDVFTAGLIVSHGQGDGTYSQPSGAGDMDATLTGVYPFARYALTDRLSVWGVAGYGEGELTLTPEDQPATDADMDLTMGAAGARALLVDPGLMDGMQLAAVGDVLLVRATSADAGNLAATEAEASRVRVGLESSWRIGEGLVPSIELGLRHDDGDAETGFGMEVGAGVAWFAPSLRLRAELSGRALLTHAESDYREWGLSGSVSIAPGARGRGLSMRMEPGYGVAGNVGRLWSDGSRTFASLTGDTSSGPGLDGTEQARLLAELGYGLPAFGGRFTGTPYSRFALSENAREYHVGWRLTNAVTSDPGFEIGLEASHRETVAAAEEHGVMLRGLLNW